MKPFNWARPGSLETLGRALRRAREEAKKTMDELARETGISKPYISNIETARAPGPASEEKLRALAKALSLPANELLAGADWLRTPASVRKALLESERHQNREDVPRRSDGSINLDALMPGEAPEPGEAGEAGGAGGTGGAAGLPLRAVPVINRVAAGSAKEFTDLGYPAGVADGYVPAPDLPEASMSAAFAVKVAGDSMMPEYREGEVLIVGPGQARDGDDCVVRLGEAEGFATTFKRVFFEKDGEGEAVAVRLVPLNPAHAERRMMLEEVSGIYPLIYRLVPARTAAKGVKASEKLRLE